jgi:hypothetical protein
MNRRTLIQSAGAAAMVPLILSAGSASAQITDDTVYELRVYHLNEGKQPLILDRFRSKETKIFERLGMHNVAFWIPTDETTNFEAPGRTLIYLMRHKSREAARESWAKFKVDPEWVALKAETEKDGTFVIKNESTFMKLTDFSPKI